MRTFADYDWIHMKPSFTELELLEPLTRSLSESKYLQPTPIQAQAIPHLLRGGDLLACAQTGTGKTAAFALPTLQRLHLAERRREKRRARCLVLTPTRELAAQVTENFQRYARYLKMRHAVVYGGVSPVPQIKALAMGVDVLVATPGRLLDLLNQKKVRLDAVETLVLDEADRMFDMGFLPDVKKILSHLGEDRQTLLFSATMPKEVARLAESLLSKPKKIHIAPKSTTAELIDDRVMFVERGNKRSLLLEVLGRDEVERVIVFTRTKHKANRLSRDLGKRKIRAAAIHSDKSQGARQRALKDFSSKRTKVLVATDVVARGIDVEGVSHVINYEIPNEAESYVHRIGRTARAGSSGVALSFCDSDETQYLASIEKLLKRKVEICDQHSHHASDVAEKYAQAPKNKKAVNLRGRRRPSRGRRSNSRRRRN